MRAFVIASMLLFVGANSEAQGSNQKSVKLGTLEFTSSVTVVEDAKILKTEVRVANRGRDTTQLLAPAECSLALLVYRQFPGAEAPIWDGRRKERACSQALRVFTLAPDSSITLVETDPVALVRQRTAPGTLYYFSCLVYLGRGGSSLELPTGTGQIP